MSSITLQDLNVKLFNIAHPVGSFIYSRDQRSPAEYIDGGQDSVWTLIQGKILFGADNDHPANSTGGSLSHSHELSKTHAAANVRFPSGICVQGAVADSSVGNIQPFSGNQYWKTSTTINGTFANSDWTPQPGIGLYGRTEDNSTLPPYIAVYLWERTS